MGLRRTFEFITNERLTGAVDAKRRRRGGGGTAATTGEGEQPPQQGGDNGEGKKENEQDLELESWEEVLRKWIEQDAQAGSIEAVEDAGGSSSIPASLEASLATTSIDQPSSSVKSPVPPSLPRTQSEIDKAQDEAIFNSSYIPRSLSEVYDPERDVDQVNRGEGKNLIYARSGGVGIVGIQEEGEDEEGDSEEGQDASASDEDEGEDGFQKKGPRGHRHEDKATKKERKKALKEETREKRKDKIPKKLKKQKIKKTSSSK
uniref:RIO/RIO1 protein kinase n=1 Tax=Phaffia rhodozyma TaxID=264483 RepID=A0A1I9Q731_PHARH|nr:RIO/RIO1 protein kinase [Phaffia rhodozyma]